MILWKKSTVFVYRKLIPNHKSYMKLNGLCYIINENVYTKGGLTYEV